MRRVVWWLTAVAVSAVPVQGGLLEDNSGGLVAYQFDAGNHHDAPDTCAEASMGWEAPIGGTTDGIVVVADDMSDVFLMDVPASLVGARLDLYLSESHGSLDVKMAVEAPACSGSIFDPVHWPAPFPSPPAPLADQVQASLTDFRVATWDCEAAWTFRVRLDGHEAPDALHVAWSDGTEETLLADHVNPIWTRFSADHGNVLPTGAWVNMPAEWGAGIEVEAGPCAAVHGGAVYGDPPSGTDTYISFTPIRSGPHTLQVTFTDPEAGAPPTAVPATCHFCVSGTDELALNLSYFVRIRSG